MYYISIIYSLIADIILYIDDVDYIWWLSGYCIYIKYKIVI